MESQETAETRGWKHRLGLLFGSFCLPWRAWLLSSVLRMLPNQVLAPYRAQLYRLAGFKGIDRAGVYFEGVPHFRGDHDIYRRFTVGTRTTIGSHFDVDLGGDTTIGAGVVICHHVSIFTTTHEIGPAEYRGSTCVVLPVTIGNGVWVGAHSVIGAGVTIGAGSVVAPGSIVLRDMPANVLIQGSPARIVRWLERDAGAPASEAAEPTDGVPVVPEAEPQVDRLQAVS